MAVTTCMSCGTPIEAKEEFCPDCKAWLQHESKLPAPTKANEQEKL